MWLEETISPSTSSSGTTRVSKRRSARAAGRRRPRALWPKRKFSPTETCVAPSRPTSTWSMKSCADCARRTRRRTGSRRAPRRRAPRSARPCARAASAAAARRRGATTAIGCGSKVSTVSAPRITSRWPRWTPSNVPTATRRGPALGVREPGDLSRAEAYDGLERRRPRGLGEATGPSSSTSSTSPVAGARDRRRPWRGAAGARVAASSATARQEPQRLGQRHDAARGRRRRR